MYTVTEPNREAYGPAAQIMEGAQQVGEVRFNQHLGVWQWSIYASDEAEKPSLTGEAGTLDEAREQVESL